MSDIEVEAISRVIRSIPAGKVATYGHIAKLAGLPGRARMVGYVLRQATGQDLPWFRIVNSQGRSSLPAGSEGRAEQLRRLAEEGVPMIGDRVLLKQALFEPDLDYLRQ